MSARVQLKFVAPNLVTSVGIAVGMLSVTAALGGRTALAAWLVIIAVLLDKLDGTVARLLKASSRFGEQMDSFSDLITFGVAPVVFFLGWSDGQIIAGRIDPLYRVVTYSCGFLYVIAAALRLAKFNIFSSYFGKDYFYGVPTTLCGALLAASTLTLLKYQAGTFLLYFMPVAHAGLALLMVSNVPLPKLGRRRAAWLNVFQIANIALAYLVGLSALLVPREWRFPEYLLGCALLYLIAGIVSSLARGVQAPPLPPPGQPTAGGPGEPPPAAPAAGGNGDSDRPGDGGEPTPPATVDGGAEAAAGAPTHPAA
jgi:CDP-diacylglycerol--serine O-phosphatidyltransferase